MGGKPVLEWVAEGRATECQWLGGVIVLTTGDGENRFVRALIPPDVPVYVASAADVLGCFAAALTEYPAESAVRMGADFPFLDPALLDRLVLTAEADPGLDYAAYQSKSGQPAVLLPAGVYAEWFAWKPFGVRLDKPGPGPTARAPRITSLPDPNNSLRG